MADFSKTIRDLEVRLKKLEGDYESVWKVEREFGDRMEQLMELFQSRNTLENTLQHAQNLMKGFRACNLEYDNDQKKAKELDDTMKDMEAELKDLGKELKANKDDKELKKKYELKEKAYEKQRKIADSLNCEIEGRMKTVEMAEQVFEDYIDAPFNKSLPLLTLGLKTIVKSMDNFGSDYEDWKKLRANEAKRLEDLELRQFQR